MSFAVRRKIQALVEVGKRSIVIAFVETNLASRQQSDRILRILVDERREVGFDIRRFGEPAKFRGPLKKTGLLHFRRELLRPLCPAARALHL